MEDPNGFLLLKRAMLHDVSDHLYQFGSSAFVFVTRKSYETVSNAIRERRDRPFFLVDVTEGINRENFKTNINVDDLKKRLAEKPLSTDGILDKIFRDGYAALTREERDYLDANKQ